MSGGGDYRGVLSRLRWDASTTQGWAAFHCAQTHEVLIGLSPGVF